VKILMKAKAANIGEVRHRKNGPHMKMAPGKWVRVKKVGNKWVPDEKRKKKTKKKTDLKGLTDKKEQKSLYSKVYYQVPVKVGKKTKWKKYMSREEYLKDFPNGPELGHLVVNQNHPGNLRVEATLKGKELVAKPGVVYAKVAGEEYYSREEFLDAVKLPNKSTIKKVVNAGKNFDEKKGVNMTLEPNFRHPDWHPSMKEKLNADQRFYLGVEEGYQIDRIWVVGQQDREAHQRRGVPWSKAEFLKRLKEGKERQVDPSKVKISAKADKPKAQHLRKGLRIMFQYRGKQYEGKIINSKSVGKKGKEVKKAKTHYQIEWNPAKQTASKIKKVKDEIRKAWIKRENIQRKSEARKQISLLAQDEQAQEKVEKKLGKKLDEVFTRMNVRDDIEFQQKVLDHMGNLNDPKNPVVRVVAKRAREITTNMLERGMNPYADMTHKQIQEAALVGVFDAILDWNPKRANLSTFLMSDYTKDYVKNAINDALSVERQQFHKMSPEAKLTIFKLKGLQDNMKEALGRDPTKDEIEKEFMTVYGNAKFNIKKMIGMTRNRRVKNIIENTDSQGELDLIDNIQSHYKTPEDAFLEKEKMERFHAAMQKIMPDAKERQAVFLRYRMDESTTGKGVFGQESSYYDRKDTEDISKVKGKAYTAKDPHFRNFDEIAKTMGLKNKVEAQKLVERAIKKAQEKAKAGHESTKELQDAMMYKSFEFEEKRNFIRLYLFKSQFPEQRDKRIERELMKAHKLTWQILKAA